MDFLLRLKIVKFYFLIREKRILDQVFNFSFQINSLFKFIYDFYSQESVVNVLKDLTNNQKKTIDELSENQILNSENLKKEVSIFSKKSFELQAQIKVN